MSHGVEGYQFGGVAPIPVVAPDSHDPGGGRTILLPAHAGGAQLGRGLLAGLESGALPGCVVIGHKHAVWGLNTFVLKGVIMIISRQLGWSNG